MSIQLLKNNNIDTDMDNFEKNLRRHRRRQLTILIGVVIVCVLMVIFSYIFLQNRTFDTYTVKKSYERTDTMTTQYVEFQDYVLKYSKDGISCVNSKNQLVWSQTYDMQNPIIDVCEGSVALAEESGTDAMIFDSTGLQGSIQTTLPIRQISVSSQGVLAVLLEDGDIMRLSMYNKKGEELVSAKFELKDAGYPLQMSLSADATKLAVTFLQVQDGSVNTCLAFYNFDSVGENYEDHLVAAKTITGIVTPSIKYLDSTHCYAVGTDQLLLFEGKQIPEEVAEIPIDREILSVFYSDEQVGLILEGEEQKYAIRVYDQQGHQEFETEFDMDYQTLKFSGNNILIYNEFECMILNHSGKVLFTGDFDESISNLYTVSGRSLYMVMHASRSDLIRLR
jgi:cell division protein FtsL